jgi:transposase InsO family protein
MMRVALDQQLIADNGPDHLISRSGNVSDNAVIESFFSSLKMVKTVRLIPGWGPIAH